MFNITKFTITDGRAIASLPIYPIANEDDYLHDYKDSDIGQCISTLGVEAIIGDGIFRIGDSSIIVSVTDTGTRGDNGIDTMKKYAEDFVTIAEEALPEMSDDYKAFYQYMIGDFRNNGIYMPHYGHL